MPTTGSPGPEPTPAAAAVPGADEPGRPGLLGRWVRRDPVRAVAFVLIAIQLGWRADIATRGWFSQDEFYIAIHAVESRLDAGYLFGLFNNHLMPAGLLIPWLVTRAAPGYEFWPYAVLLTVGQALLSIAFYRLLRTLLRPGWALLVPLCLFLFCPLMLETTSLWVVGLLMLPALLAMVLAVGAQIKFVRTQRRRHLVSLAAALLLGLAFSEKALLIAPLLFMLTACLFVRGGVVRSIWRTIVHYWQSWVVVGGLSLAYTIAYILLSQDAVVPEPRSLREILVFLGDLLGTTLIPGLFGGPWRWWYAGDGPPLADPYDIAMWLSWAALLAVIVVTTLRNPVVGRAWTLLTLYFALVAGLLAATRLGNELSPLAGMVPRYVSDVALVAAIVVGAVLAGLQTAPETQPRQMFQPFATQRSATAAGTALAVLAAAVLGIGAIWTTARFRDNWDVKHGRSYLSTTQAELAKALPGTVFLDRGVPNQVIEGYWYPYNLYSKFFLPADRKPFVVTEAENPSVFDDAGHIRPATVVGVGNVPGTVEGCGHAVAEGKPTRIPLVHPVVDWPWVVYFGYVSTRDSTVTLRLGTTVRQFPVRQGLGQMFLSMQGGGDAVEVTVSDPAVVLCTNLITVGEAVAQPAS